MRALILLIQKRYSRSVGIRVDLPFEQELNPFVGLAYEHRYFLLAAAPLHDCCPTPS